MPSKITHPLQISIFLFWSSLVLIPNLAVAQSRGEIINVNPQYKIVFTDLNNSILKPGDIVSIQQNGKIVGYLQVDETTSAISKLVPVKDNVKFPSPLKFEEITIGTTVVRETGDVPVALDVPAQEQERPTVLEAPVVLSGTEKVSVPTGGDAMVPLAPSTDLEGQYQRLSQNYADLSNTLATMVSQKNEIEKKYEDLQQQSEALQLKLQTLEQENAALREEKRKCSIVDDKVKLDQCRSDVDRLQSLVETLKMKLLRINQLLIDGKSGSHEK